MKLWKQFSIQKQDTIDYFNTRKDFRPDVFAARLNQLILEELGLKPFIDCGMCLGEGTGAVAAMPLLDMAARIYSDMRTFEEYQIEEYKPL